MSPQDLNRIRFITRYFIELQGLRVMVPIGLFCLGGGIPVALGAKSPSRFALAILLWLAAMGGGLLLMRRSRSHYRSIWGEVEVEQPGAALSSKLWLFAVSFVVLGVASLIISPKTLPQFICILYSGLGFGSWIWREHRRSQVHYLVIGIIFLGLAALRAPFAFMGPMSAQMGLVQILGGAAMVLAGLLDHRLLVREMGRFTPPPELETMSPVEVQR